MNRDWELPEQSLAFHPEWAVNRDVIVELEGPEIMAFGSASARFLAVASDEEERDGSLVTRWVCAPITRLETGALKAGHTTPHDALRKSDAFVLDAEHHDGQVLTCWAVDGETLAAEHLPEEGVALPAECRTAPQPLEPVDAVFAFDGRGVRENSLSLSVLGEVASALSGAWQDLGEALGLTPIARELRAAPSGAGSYTIRASASAAAAPQFAKLAKQFQLVMSGAEPAPMVAARSVDALAASLTANELQLYTRATRECAVFVSRASILRIKSRRRSPAVTAATETERPTESYEGFFYNFHIDSKKFGFKQYPLGEKMPGQVAPAAIRRRKRAVVSTFDAPMLYKITVISKPTESGGTSYRLLDFEPLPDE